MPDPTLDEKGGAPQTPLYETLADRLFSQTRKPGQVILFTNPTTIHPPDDVNKHYQEAYTLANERQFLKIVDDIAPDFDKRLKELVARQTHLFNSDAPVQERILIHNEIETIQKKKREANR